jgi:hypothetical protein
MSRLVLLGLGDRDVDVLSQIPGLDPKPEVLVAHPDPEALILQLASLSELPTTTSAPSPREDDLVVVSAEAEPHVRSWIDSFRRAGVRIVSPAGLRLEAEGDGEGPTPARAAETQAEAPAAEAVPDATPPDGEIAAARVDEALERPPAEIWARPEATFRYLMEQALGVGAAATLSWDGGIRTWVPWVWTGEEPDSEGGSSVELSTSWGTFRVTGAAVERRLLPLAALTRVAEDLALRDLAAWQKTAAALPGAVPPGDRKALLAWAGSVLEALNPETAWLWEHEGETMRLAAAFGEGVSLAGDRVTLPESLLRDLLDEGGIQWERWEPSEHLSVHLGFSRTDRQWPLRWERIRTAMAGRRERA